MEKEISIDEVKHMALLSRLSITDEEEKVFARQFSQIINHMSVLEKISTDGIEPLYSPLDQRELTREDIAANLRTRQQILANAPETDGQYFIVPRIV